MATSRCSPTCSSSPTSGSMPSCPRNWPTAISPMPRCTGPRCACSTARPGTPPWSPRTPRTCARPPRSACARSSSAGPWSGVRARLRRLRPRWTACSKPTGSLISPRPSTADGPHPAAAPPPPGTAAARGVRWSWPIRPVRTGQIPHAPGARPLVLQLLAKEAEDLRPAIHCRLGPVHRGEVVEEAVPRAVVAVEFVRLGVPLQLRLVQVYLLGRRMLVVVAEDPEERRGETGGVVDRRHRALVGQILRRHHHA